MISRFCQILMALLIIAINTQCKNTGSNTVKDIDGNIYHTALIGKHWWMTENLKTTRYNDGSYLPCIKDQNIWLRSDSAAYCYYQNNESYADTFGIMYNWFAVNSGKLCPDGWRVPTDEEWKYFEGFVDTRYGIGDSVWQKPGLRGYDAGQRLKSQTGWRPGINGTDNFGFRALPGGERFVLESIKQWRCIKCMNYVTFFKIYVTYLNLKLLNFGTLIS
jgi:uncharacterized protein (TIGR02145 family)